MTNRTVKGLLIFTAILVTAACAFAVPVTLSEAECAVQGWLRDESSLGCPLGTSVEIARTCQAETGATFHVVKLKGNGFVVTSSDTEDEPIVAFSDGGDLIEDDNNPLWVLLKKDATFRAKDRPAQSATRVKLSVNSAAESAASAKWARLIASGSSSARAKATKNVSSVSDVRVEPLVKSTWDQKTAGGQLCYNYYTPNNYYCGCVATAGAQIMRYFEFPKGEVARYTNPYCTVSNRKTTLTTQGGAFGWDKMPLSPGWSITEEECQAIGKLTSDVGIACKMEYASSGSGTGGYMLARALTIVFGYPNAVALQEMENLPAEDVRRAMVTNFDAGLPVALSIGGPSGGHEVVGDGYGYSGEQFYCHVNLGWSGSGNAWYAPPNIRYGSNSFTVFDGLVYNIFTDSADVGATIVSGRVFDGNGNPVEDATVTARENGVSVRTTTTNAKGIYALRLPAGGIRLKNYVLSADFGSETAMLTVSVKPCIETRTDDEGYYYPDTGEMRNVADADIVLGTFELDVPEETREPLAGISNVPETAPDGDYFALPIVISGEKGSYKIADTQSYSIQYVNVENGLFTEVPMARSAWFEWTAPGNGTVTFKAASKDERGTCYPTMIAAYCGRSFFTLETVARYSSLASDNSSSITFDAYQGVTYRIIVFANGNTFLNGRTCGPYELTWNGRLEPEKTETQTTELPIPYKWLRIRYPEMTDYEVQANASGANGRPVWESYVLGIDPRDAASDLRITSFRLEDGKPVVEWNVTNQNIRALGYDYRLKKLDVEGSNLYRLVVEPVN